MEGKSQFGGSLICGAGVRFRGSLSCQHSAEPQPQQGSRAQRKQHMWSCSKLGVIVCMPSMGNMRKRSREWSKETLNG